jgi:hypothetical protein
LQEEEEIMSLAAVGTYMMIERWWRELGNGIALMMMDTARTPEFQQIRDQIPYELFYSVRWAKNAQEHARLSRLAPPLQVLAQEFRIAIINRNDIGYMAELVRKLRDQTQCPFHGYVISIEAIGPREPDQRASLKRYYQRLYSQSSPPAGAS